MRLSTHDGVDASVRERNRLGLAVIGLYTRATSEESGAHFGIRLDRDDLMSRCFEHAGEDPGSGAELMDPPRCLTDRQRAASDGYEGRTAS